MTTTLPYQHHSPTSFMSAVLSEPLARTDSELVLAVVSAAGTSGLTDEEIQRETGLAGSTERPRRIELCRKGKLIAASHRRNTSSGRPAMVWVAV